MVIDASAAVELVLGTSRGARVAGRALAPNQLLYAPHLLDVEVVQALRRLTGLQEITVGRAAEALADYSALLIDRLSHRELLPRVWELRGSLTAYDAVYVALAEGLDATLLTCDGKLAGAHGHHAAVELIVEDEL